MEKTLRCGDIVPGCTAEVRAATEEEAMRQGAEHARTAHGLTELDQATADKVRAAIRTAR